VPLPSALGAVTFNVMALGLMPEQQGLHIRKLLLQGFVLLDKVRRDGHWHGLHSGVIAVRAT